MTQRTSRETPVLKRSVLRNRPAPFHRVLGSLVCGVTLVVFGLVGFAGPSAAASSAPTWTDAGVPAPPGAVSSSLGATSCPDASFCVAVGSTATTPVPPPSPPLAYAWDGTSWSQMTIPATGAGDEDFLRGVSCSSPTACVAVGVVLPSQAAFAEVWNGSAWSIVPPATPTGAVSTYFNAVECIGSTDCVAVGGWGDAALPAAFHTLVERWDGSTWSVMTSPDATGSTNSQLQGVSCWSSDGCFAVGAAGVGSSATTFEPLTEKWDGTAWSTVAAPTSGLSSRLNGVSCTGDSFCQAVGSSNPVSPTVQASLTERWDGTAWSIDPSPNETTSTGLSGVSCLASDWCAASGSGQFGTTQSVLEHWDGTDWAVADSPAVGASGTSLNGVSCADGGTCMAVGETTAASVRIPIALSTGVPEPTPPVPTYGPGYLEVASDGGLFAFGDAPFAGSMGGKALDKPIVGMAVDPITGGYWEVASDGGIFAFGGAQFAGSMGGKPLNKPIVGMAATDDGLGYYLVASDGGIFAFGDAQFAGSVGGKPLNKPIVGMAVDPATGGYYLVASDGGIFAFGGAQFSGSMGGKPLNKPIVGMAVDPVTGGYWEVASDGGIFAFGDAPFLGSMGGKPLNAPIVGIGA